MLINLCAETIKKPVSEGDKIFDKLCVEANAAVYQVSVSCKSRITGEGRRSFKF